MKLEILEAFSMNDLLASPFSLYCTRTTYVIRPPQTLLYCMVGPSGIPHRDTPRFCGLQKLFVHIKTPIAVTFVPARISKMTQRRKPSPSS